MQAEQCDARVSTGITGLDHLLGGGLPPKRVYLIEGDPGSGKTTLGLQFLRDGIEQGEKVLYVTLSETRSELVAVAASHGWTLDGMTIHELSPSDESFRPDDQYTFFHPSEVELSVTTKAVLAEVERINPSRVVFDSLSEMRLLAREPLRYRRQILGLKQFFVGRNCTVFLLDDKTAQDGDLQLQSLAHGVVALEQLAPEYGAERRRLRIIKMRGVRFQGGFHDFIISTGGLHVFPRLVAAESRANGSHGSASSGIPRLDALLGGGFDRGTSSLFMGPAGAGKSAIATHVAVAAAKRGEHVAVYLFDEGLDTFRRRAAGLGADITEHVESGRIVLTQVDPAEMSPGEFADKVRNAVDQDHAAVVVIDSLNGYLNAMPEERYLVAQLHELFMFLRQRGVLAISVVAQHGMVGQMQAPVDLSYLADNVLLLRFFEADGAVRHAISVMKKRSGPHEKTIRELRLEASGINVGEPLTEFHGVLTGVPRHTGGGRVPQRAAEP
ncbi:MAG: Non-specific serine/threonine protein kinase [Acidobacteria bacterium]|nr:Non-specific serine/threonine protein kinase [Acidobacteriota bacterium]